MKLLTSWRKFGAIMPWLPAYAWQRCVRRSTNIRPVHLVLGVADHFEPMQRSETFGKPVDFSEQERRLKKWCLEYPAGVGAWRDDDGQPLRHTYFYPAEELNEALLDRLVEFCRAGWGEIEIHLHHGVEA